jgi:hypothetical protein
MASNVNDLLIVPKCRINRDSLRFSVLLIRATLSYPDDLVYSMGQNDGSVANRRA